MRVYLYNFNKRFNSTGVPPRGSDSRQFVLKSGCSIQSPVLILQLGTIASGRYNYAYIPDFGRYYYITDTQILTGNRVQISLQTDLLASFRNDILNDRVYIERTSDRTLADYAVYDGAISNTTDRVSEHQTRNGFRNPYNINGCYILRTISQQGITSYALSESEIRDVLSFMFDDSNFTDAITDQSIKTIFNPFQYIVSLMWIPLNKDSITGSDEETVCFGWWQSNTRVNRIDREGVTFTTGLLNIPANIYTDWRANSSSFSQYTITIPGIGTMNLPSADARKGLAVTGLIDINTGVTDYYLTVGGELGATPVLASYHTRLGVDLQIGQVSANVTGAISSGASAIDSILHGNIAGAVGGVINTVQTVSQPTPSINGTQGAVYQLGYDDTVRVTCINYGSTQTPDNVIGYPCYKKYPLSFVALGSFVKCINPSVQIDSKYGCLESEIEAINNSLSEGIFLQ